MSVLSEAILKKAYNEAKKIHSSHLAKAGVAFPKWGSARGYWLSLLIHRKGKWASGEEISETTRKYMPNAAANQQVRHLKRLGWNMETKGNKHRIVDPSMPALGFKGEQAGQKVVKAEKRDERTKEKTEKTKTMSGKTENKAEKTKTKSGKTEKKVEKTRQKKPVATVDFAELKKTHNNRCIICGAVEGKEHPSHAGSAKVKLQKGRRDPGKEHDMENTIPQCQYCKRSYRDDFIFDKKGRAKAVASVTPVQRASKNVQQEIKKWLDENL